MLCKEFYDFCLCISSYEINSESPYSTNSSRKFIMNFNNKYENKLVKCDKYLINWSSYLNFSLHSKVLLGIMVPRLNLLRGVFAYLLSYAGLLHTWINLFRIRISGISKKVQYFRDHP